MKSAAYAAHEEELRWFFNLATNAYRSLMQDKVARVEVVRLTSELREGFDIQSARELHTQHG